MSLLIETTTAKMAIKDAVKVSELSVYTAANTKPSGTKTELSFPKAASPKTGKYWRLIYHPKKLEALELFESEGTTQTPWSMFCGTLEECAGEIERLKLNVDKIQKKIEGVKPGGGVGGIPKDDDPVEGGGAGTPKEGVGK